MNTIAKTLPEQSSMLNIVHVSGNDDLARVFVAELEDGARIELVESVQRPVPREEKWVLIVSTLKGCPVRCPICDAGGDYRGKLTRDELLAQIDFLVGQRCPGGRPDTRRLKIQFARMGDPAFNDAVLDVLEILPDHLGTDAVQPSISTVAPASRDRFFDRLLDIKNRRYPGGRFQMQFSLHTTDEVARRRLVPVKTWSLDQMAAYGERFVGPGDLKVSLNFAPAKGVPLDPEALREWFDPEKFIVKLTPINPTVSAVSAGLEGVIDPDEPRSGEVIAQSFERLGYRTILSIGDVEENRIGSNCGMYLTRAR